MSAERKSIIFETGNYGDVTVSWLDTQPPTEHRITQRCPLAEGSVYEALGGRSLAEVLQQDTDELAYDGISFTQDPNLADDCLMDEFGRVITETPEGEVEQWGQSARVEKTDKFMAGNFHEVVISLAQGHAEQYPPTL